MTIRWNDVSPGQLAQSQGAANEDAVESMLMQYAAQSGAYWRKTEPKIKNLGSLKGGVFRAVYAAKGMPDYLLMVPDDHQIGNRGVILFDAKQVKAVDTTTIKGSHQLEQMILAQATGQAIGGFLVRWYYDSNATTQNEWRWHPCQTCTLETTTITKSRRGHKQRQTIQVVRIDREAGLLVESDPTFTADTPGLPHIKSLLEQAGKGLL